jgi:hypothetical protein
VSGWEEGLGNAAETLSNPALPWAGAVVVVLAVLAWLSLRQTRPKPPAPPPVRLHPDPVVDAALREKAAASGPSRTAWTPTHGGSPTATPPSAPAPSASVRPAGTWRRSATASWSAPTTTTPGASRDLAAVGSGSGRGLPTTSSVTRATSDRGPRPGRSIPCTATRRPGTAYFGLHNGTTAVGGASDS